MIRSPPPFVHALSFSLEETGTDQTNPIFWGLQNWFWRWGNSGHPDFSEIRKILVSIKFIVHNSGARSGCANFMGAWKNVFFLQENLHVHKIPRFRGGGYFVFFWGGKCRFYFYGRGDFSDETWRPHKTLELFSARIGHLRPNPVLDKSRAPFKGLGFRNCIQCWGWGLKEGSCSIPRLQFLKEDNVATTNKMVWSFPFTLFYSLLFPF